MQAWVMQGMTAWCTRVCDGGVGNQRGVWGRERELRRAWRIPYINLFCCFVLSAFTGDVGASKGTHLCFVV